MKKIENMNKMYALIIFVYLCVTMQHDVTYAKRILIVTNIARYSHQISYRGLALELNKRGHEIVSVTPNPIKNSTLKNYKEIDLSYFYKGFPEYKNFLIGDFNRYCMEITFYEMESLLWSLIHILNKYVYENSEMKKLYAADSGEHFDAVIVGQGPTISLNALAYRFNAPLIGISSLDVFNHLRFTTGSLLLPSHSSNWQIEMQESKTDTSFWTRLVNFYFTWKQIYLWMNVYYPLENALAKKYFGNDLPDINDITRNMSIYLVNKHSLLSMNRPEQHNIIFYHGSHIMNVPPALPADVKQFLDGAKNGFIYFSFGSGFDWKNVSSNLMTSFVDALSTVPYRVLWKMDAPFPPGKFENIMTSKWLPQQGILAHRNIKLYIYQGGVQSTEEAVYYGVPIIGYPIFWDQTYQVQNMIRLGVGIHLQHDTLSKESVQTAVYEVINNERYKNQMMELSRRYKDAPYNSLENAALWVEYVMRQNGTLFLRDGLYDIPWYQRYDWDIIGFLAIMAFVACLVIYYAVFQFLRFVYIYCQNPYDNSQSLSTKRKVQ